MGKVLKPACKNCGHSAYHCPASGCNHHDADGWCDCEEYAPGSVEVNPADVSPGDNRA